MQRNVQFWRIVEADGRECKASFPAVELVKKLEVASALMQDRHRVCRNGMTVLAHAAGLSPLPTLLLDKVRRENYPSIGDEAGHRQPMRLNSGEGLLEPTYFSFLPNNVVAVLVNGNGPHPQRLAEYVRTKFRTPMALVPVLRHDLDAVLDEMRFTQVEVAVPAERVDRGLVGGDWVEALDGARSLSHDGIIRIGISVGQKGDAQYKESFSERMRGLVSELRQATGIGEFSTARVKGKLPGRTGTQVIDLIQDRFVERVEVDPEKFADPDRATRHAMELLAAAGERRREYLDSTLPRVGPTTGMLGDFNEAIDNGHPDNV